jgi:DNA repair exonuclease SbcCD ATPase subunit
MRLHALRLREFRCFEQFDLEFDSAFTFLAGANGSGKSTLLEGVIWALYGGGAGAVRRSEASLRRTAAAGATSAALQFSTGGNEYVVQRDLAVDAGDTDEVTVTASLRRAEGELLAVGEDEVTETVGALLGASREVLLHACVTGRRELQQLVHLRPVDRLRTLARLLGRSVSRRSPVDHALLHEVQALQQELTDLDERIGALRSAPDLLVQYTRELEQLRPELAESEMMADRLQDEWSQKRQDVDTRLLAASRRGEELQRQITRLATAGAAGTCPTCGQGLGERADDVVARLDDEFYVVTQDVKWLTQRQAQLARRPPELREAEQRRDRLRSTVDERTARAARCEQAMQELWTVAGERKRTAERLDAMRAGPAVAASPGHDALQPLVQADLMEVGSLAAGFLSAITGGRLDGLEITADGRIYGLHNGAPAPVVSGGDEDAMAFALRLAIMRMAAAQHQAPDLLILDEPFGTLDDQREERLADLLRQIARAGTQVVLASSHTALARPQDSLIPVGAR